MSPKSSIKFPILLMALFFIAAITLGFIGRHLFLNRYHEGVRLYLNGNYSKALILFDGLRGWGEGIVDITPEEYCEMVASKIDIKLCPECGAIID